MIEQKAIRNLVDQKLEGTDLFLVDITVSAQNRIRIFIDGDQGVSVEACKELSRFVEHSLDREQEDFELEVSSPGLDRPLKLDRQFKKNIGKRLKVVRIEGSVIKGELEGYTPETIQVLADIKDKKTKKVRKESLTINRAEIKEALIEISF